MNKLDIRLLLELADTMLPILKSANAFSDTSEYDFQFQENLKACCGNLEALKTILTEKLEEGD